MSISEHLLTELDAEIKTTRETLSRVPDTDKADFKPHPKSMKLGSLAPRRPTRRIRNYGPHHSRTRFRKGQHAASEIRIAQSAGAGV